ncbi:MAG: hypothetical protein JNJ57_13655 [Saprospiraceae bacterium]|nr:hypothetical protein [Saprospiraceae bacterium]
MNLTKTAGIPALWTILSLILIAMNACNEPVCGYEEPCEERCELFEDFETDPVGPTTNWLTTAANASIQVQGGSNTLYLQDLSGGSSAYNTIEFPKNLLEAGCELHYSVQYLAGSSNATSAPNSINIFTGTSLATATTRAYFELNSGSAIVSGATPVTIEVPLELASGGALPSNAFGTWKLIGGSTVPTPADIAAFNTLIQNIDGVGFVVDNGGNPAEEWWYDDFCFWQCCK